ncbi:DUF5684 domain-containing protein [uncultured Anaerofustis sp.]|uniref:DUF5684 domain-containing protein n=1 Tax=uncultured Anaerofustis sp. TaxID=904996 RepID=UPI0025FFB428|nr:DUF5684 domain-containing protein [uncultured Anaerofustis sp.]
MISFNIPYYLIRSVLEISYISVNYVWIYLKDIYTLMLNKTVGLNLKTIDVGWISSNTLATGWEASADIQWISPWITFVFPLILIVLTILARWKVFEKAGEKGWKALIPFYGTFTLCKITFGFGWYMFLFFIPIADLVLYIMMYIKLGKKFNKSKSFTLGLIFLSNIFMLILGYGNSKYLNH